VLITEVDLDTARCKCQTHLSSLAPVYQKVQMECNNVQTAFNLT